MELHAKQTLFAEGCRGSLTKALMERFKLREGVDPQTYGIGIKELWEIDPAKHKPGLVVHTIGWPLDAQDLWRLVALPPGEQPGLGRLRRSGSTTRTRICRRSRSSSASRRTRRSARIFEGGRRISYGARALSEGGFQSIPKLTFPGGALIGDTAGFLNVPKIKGNAHRDEDRHGLRPRRCSTHLRGRAPSGRGRRPIPSGCKQSWLWEELYRVRNIRPSFHRGLWGGIAYSALDTYRAARQGAVDAARTTPTTTR